jgi:hypothetical protein
MCRHRDKCENLNGHVGCMAGEDKSILKGSGNDILPFVLLHFCILSIVCYSKKEYDVWETRSVSASFLMAEVSSF